MLLKTKHGTFSAKKIISWTDSDSLAATDTFGNIPKIIGMPIGEP